MPTEVRERYDKILAIVKRAQALNIAEYNQFTQFMDIDAAFNQFELRLDDMLNADDYEFMHDFEGIQNHINRKTGKIKGFVPRFSGHTM